MHEIALLEGVMVKHPVYLGDSDVEELEEREVLVV